MELAFGTRRLREICEDQAVADRNLSSLVSELLRGRLADLHAARSLEEFVAGRPTLDPDDERVLVFELAEGVVLRVQVNHANPPLLTDGTIDWSRVRRLKIVSIGTEHD
jgi:proteic killer suppression protein